MRYMLDTDTCIYIIKNKPNEVIERFKKYDIEEICISSITYSELMYGVRKSQQSVKNYISLILFVNNIEIMDYDSKAGECYGDIKTELEIKGTPIGSLDTLIAAHAKSLGYTIITNNTKEYKRINGLKVENWVN